MVWVNLVACLELVLLVVLVGVAMGSWPSWQLMLWLVVMSMVSLVE